MRENRDIPEIQGLAKLEMLLNQKQHEILSLHTQADEYSALGLYLGVYSL